MAVRRAGLTGKSRDGIGERLHRQGQSRAHRAQLDGLPAHGAHQAAIGLAAEAPSGFLLVAVAVEHGVVIIIQHQAVGVRAPHRYLLQLVRLAISPVVIAADAPCRFTTGAGRGDGEVQDNGIRGAR